MAAKFYSAFLCLSFFIGLIIAEDISQLSQLTLETYKDIVQSWKEKGCKYPDPSFYDEEVAEKNKTVLSPCKELLIRGGDSQENKDSLELCVMIINFSDAMCKSNETKLQAEQGFSRQS